MKRHLLFLAGLCTGLAILATTLIADDPVTTEEPGILINGETYICHYPPGQNGRSQGKAPQEGKVVLTVVSLEDFVIDCEIPRREEAALHDVEASDASTPPRVCYDWAAYDAEIEGHLDNHGDCILQSPEMDCPAMGDAYGDWCHEIIDSADGDDE